MPLAPPPPSERQRGASHYRAKANAAAALHGCAQVHNIRPTRASVARHPAVRGSGCHVWVLGVAGSTAGLGTGAADLARGRREIKKRYMALLSPRRGDWRAHGLCQAGRTTPSALINPTSVLIPSLIQAQHSVLPLH